MGWAARHRSIFTAAAALALLIVGAEARAQDSKEVDVIVTDRPDVAESSETVGQLRFQVEMGIDVEVEGGADNRVGFRTPTKLRFGVLDDLELHVETDGFSWDSMDTSSGRQASIYGFSDVAVGFKAHITDGGQLAGAIPSTALLVSIALDSGTEGFSAGAHAPGAVVAMDWELPADLSVGFNFGLEVPAEVDVGGNSRRYWEGSFAVALSRPWAPLTDELRTYVELFGALGYSGPARSTLLIDGGFAYTPRKNIQLDLAVRGGLTEATPDFGVGVGLSFKL
jgi:Putative MetA-pathway of phenol degradation